MKTNNKKNNEKMNNMTKVIRFNQFRLSYRFILFIIALLIYVYNLINNNHFEISFTSKYNVFLLIVWFVFVVEMVFRLFPSKLESPGSQKHFKRNYQKTGKTNIVIEDNHAVLLVGLLWLSLNVIFGCLKLLGILDDGFMFILFLFYSICDLICILFFCPFQTFFLKNKCCVQCRIYNWDYAMMLTPMFFVVNVYSWTLLFLSIVILFKWELTVYMYPERFSKNTNKYLFCINCSEKLCKSKKQLNSLWVSLAEFSQERIEKLKNS